MMARWLAWGLALALVYLALCAALFVFQRSLIYFPQPRSEGLGGAPLVLSAADGEQIHVSVRPRTGAKALIYFGGNAEDVTPWLPVLADTFPEHALYLMHYRGYGGSGGRPSQAALFADALALFDRVRQDHAEVLVIGRSLGSGVAVHLASERPVARLVLVTPYDSILGLAEQQFPWAPVRWLLRDPYESWRDAPQITAPTLLIAAERDEVIPRASTEALRDRFAPGVARYRVLAGAGHNSIASHPEYLPLLTGAR